MALVSVVTAVVVLGPSGVATAVPPEHFPVEHVDPEFVIEDQFSFR